MSDVEQPDIDRANNSWLDRNPAARHLYELGIIETSAVTVLHPRCRDAEVRVLKCHKSGVIFLEDAQQTSGDYYQMPSTDPVLRYGINRNPPQNASDVARRTALLKGFPPGSRWLDVGAGDGSLVDEMLQQSHFALVEGVEPNLFHSTSMRRRGIRCERSVASVAADETRVFDVVSLFHVLEHLHHAEILLGEIRSILARDGYLLVEVPHAADVLLQNYECEAFKRWTFWSEHLVLHTADSLRALIRNAGFAVLEIRYIQRYGLANHMYWLSRAQPGGHEAWRNFFSQELDTEYERCLGALRSTDSLLAVASPE